MVLKSNDNGVIMVLFTDKELGGLLRMLLVNNEPLVDVLEFELTNVLEEVIKTDKKG